MKVSLTVVSMEVVGGNISDRQRRKMESRKLSLTDIVTVFHYASGLSRFCLARSDESGSYLIFMFRAAKRRSFKCCMIVSSY